MVHLIRSVLVKKGSSFFLYPGNFKCTPSSSWGPGHVETTAPCASRRSSAALREIFLFGISLFACLFAGTIIKNFGWELLHLARPLVVLTSRVNRFTLTTSF